MNQSRVAWNHPYHHRRPHPVIVSMLLWWMSMFVLHHVNSLQIHHHPLHWVSQIVAFDVDRTWYHVSNVGIWSVKQGLYYDSHVPSFVDQERVVV